MIEKWELWSYINRYRPLWHKPVYPLPEKFNNQMTTYVLANWIEMSNNNSPTVAISSVFHSPFGKDTPKYKNRFFFLNKNCNLFSIKFYKLQLTYSFSRIQIGCIYGIVSYACLCIILYTISVISSAKF